VKFIKTLSDGFPIYCVLKHTDIASLLISRLPLLYTISKIQVNQVGLEINGKYQFWTVLIILMFWM